MRNCTQSELPHVGTAQTLQRALPGMGRWGPRNGVRRVRGQPETGGVTRARLARALKANALLVNLAILLIGMILVLSSFVGKSGVPLSTVLLSVGGSVVAAGVVGGLVGLYEADEQAREKALGQWRLAGVYRTRADMNRSSNERLIRCRDQLDIAAFGLKGFRESQGGLVTEKVRAGLRVRILCPHPDSAYVTAREASEGEVPGQIKKTIVDLEDWVARLRAEAREPHQVQLRYYDALPLDFFFHVDDTVFVGPYLHGRGSQQTISMEFERPGAGFDYWCEYFDGLWSDEEFAHDALPTA
ncbi:MAG TPA: hypothetical protein VGX28_07975 [Frankiaceae bacterium]|nr:hypothetical protein [Frankiaceae bacterium]